jgi:hypothetical protein
MRAFCLSPRRHRHLAVRSGWEMVVMGAEVWVGVLVVFWVSHPRRS